MGEWLTIATDEVREGIVISSSPALKALLERVIARGGVAALFERLRAGSRLKVKK